jgi:hypothetical protein
LPGHVVTGPQGRELALEVTAKLVTRDKIRFLEIVEDGSAERKVPFEDRFDLSFLRHTGQWVEPFTGLTVEKCLKAIQDDPWFQP